MRSSTTAGKFGTFSALTLASAAVLVFHTAALAQQTEAKKDATKDATPEPRWAFDDLPLGARQDLLGSDQLLSNALLQAGLSGSTDSLRR